MVPAILGKKVGMTQIFDEVGRVVSVTVVQAGPCTVLQVRSKASDGYEAVQLGFGDVKAHRSTLPMIGHAAKAHTSPKQFVREIRLDEPTEHAAGDLVTVEVFEEAGVEYVDIVQADTLAPLDRLAGECLIALAVRIGRVRLIDNAVVDVS